LRVEWRPADKKGDNHSHWNQKSTLKHPASSRLMMQWKLHWIKHHLCHCWPFNTVSTLAVRKQDCACRWRMYINTLTTVNLCLCPTWNLAAFF
jgi:hypothetical protein